jgi:hypothetical protein
MQDITKNYTAVSPVLLEPTIRKGELILLGINNCTKRPDFMSCSFSDNPYITVMVEIIENNVFWH